MLTISCASLHRPSAIINCNKATVMMLGFIITMVQSMQPQRHGIAQPMYYQVQQAHAQPIHYHHPVGSYPPPFNHGQPPRMYSNGLQNNVPYHAQMWITEKANLEKEVARLKKELKKVNRSNQLLEAECRERAKKFRLVITNEIPRLEGNENFTLIWKYTRNTMDTWKFNMHELLRQRNLNKEERFKLKLTFARRGKGIKQMNDTQIGIKLNTVFKTAAWWYKSRYEDGQTNCVIRSTFDAMMRLNYIGNKLVHGDFHIPTVDKDEELTKYKDGILPNHSDLVQTVLQEIQESYKIIEYSTLRDDTHGINDRLKNHFTTRARLLERDIKHKQLVERQVNPVTRKKIIKDLYDGLPGTCATCDYVKSYINQKGCSCGDALSPNGKDDEGSLSAQNNSSTSNEIYIDIVDSEEPDVAV